MGFSRFNRQQVPPISSGALRTPQDTGSEVGRGVVAVGGALEQAGNRIIARNDAVAVSRSFSNYGNQAADLLRALETTEDITSEQVIQGYSQSLNELQQDLIQNFPGSAAGRAQLAGMLAQQDGVFRNQMAVRSVQVGRNNLDREIQQRLEQSRKNLRLDPEYRTAPGMALSRAFDQIDAELDMFAPGITPDRETVFRRVGRSQLVMDAANDFLDQGDPEAARRIMENPTLQQHLSLEEIDAFNRRLQNFDALGDEVNRRIAIARAHGLTGADVERQITSAFLGLDEPATQLSERERLFNQWREARNPTAAEEAEFLQGMLLGGGGGRAGSAKGDVSFSESLGAAFESKRRAGLLRELVVQIDTGPREEATITLRKWAEAVGFPIDEEKLANQEVFRSELIGFTLERLNPLKGSTSDREFNFVVAQSAGLGTSIEGNIKMIASMSAYAEIAVQRMELLANLPPGDRQAQIDVYKSLDDTQMRARAREIEQEMIAERALRFPTKGGRTAADFEDMAPLELRDWVNRNESTVRTLPPDILDVITRKFNDAGIRQREQ
jgi:hypothetical protein